MRYTAIRNLYYLGILTLILYAFPAVEPITKYVYPVLNYEIIPALPIITLIAIMTGVGVFVAYKYRKIG